jgi:predicted DNA-binding protein YlxM (UPF0122 family)
MKPDRVDAALLFDVYGSLLTDRQKRIWQLYWSEDWSLSEIAEAQATSRAAVHDVLDRAYRSLAAYEAALGLVQAFKERREALADLQAVLDAVPMSERWRERVMAAYQRVAKEDGIGDV